MNRKIEKEEFKRFINLIFFTIITFIVIISITLINQKPSEKIINNEETLISIKEIGEDFLYYNGDIYYKNKSLCLIEKSDLSEQIGEVSYHLKYDDITNNSFIYNNDNRIYAYAVEVGTPIFIHKTRDDVLLVQTEYNYNNYYVFIKNKIVSEFNDLEYYIDNQNNIDSIKLISYMSKEIPVDITLDDIKINDNHFYISTLIDGFMAYYLLLENNGLYIKYECTGNIYSNIILIDSKDKQYMYENKELSNILIDMYSDFFELNNSSK